MFVTKVELTFNTVEEFNTFMKVLNSGIINETDGKVKFKGFEEKEEKITEEDLVETDEEVPFKEESKYTLEDIREKFVELNTKENRKELKKILDALNVPNVSKIPEEYYDAVMAQLEVIGG